MMGCHKTWDECDCSCHHTDAVHVVACCYGCGKCGKNIKSSMHAMHIESCEGPEPIPDWIQKMFDPGFVKVVPKKKPK